MNYPWLLLSFEPLRNEVIHHSSPRKGRSQLPPPFFIVSLSHHRHSLALWRGWAL